MPGLDATARQLEDGTTTSSQLVDAALARDVPGAVEQRLETARAVAAGSDDRRARGRPLSRYDGIPFGVKANLNLAGVPTSAGTGLRHAPPGTNADAVAALVRHGLVPVFTTTLAEAALGAVTDNPHSGRCANPRFPHLQAGGSSGGSAAVVAADAVPVALGSDTMGSVRIPAAYCGVASYKPTRGRESTRGLVPLHPMLDTVGHIAQDARDLAALMELARPEDVGGPTQADAVVIGVPDLADLSDDDGQVALQRAVDALASGGARIVRGVKLGIDPALVRRRGLLLCEVGGYRVHRAAVDSGDPGISDALRALLRYGAGVSEERARAVHDELLDVSAAVQARIAGLDALVLPTTPGSVPMLGEDPPHAADLTAWVNVAGLPSVAFPSRGWRETDTEPVRSVQLVGPPNADSRIIRLAASLQPALLATS